MKKFLLNALVCFSVSIASAVDLGTADQFLAFQYDGSPEDRSHIQRGKYTGDFGYSALNGESLTFDGQVDLTGDVYHLDPNVDIQGGPTTGSIVLDQTRILQARIDILSAWNQVWSLSSDTDLGVIDLGNDYELDFSSSPDNEIVIDVEKIKLKNGTMTIRGNPNQFIYFRVLDTIELDKYTIVVDGFDASRLFFVSVSPTEVSAPGKLDPGEVFSQDSNIIGTFIAPYSKIHFDHMKSFAGAVYGAYLRHFSGQDNNSDIGYVKPETPKSDQVIEVFSPVNGTTFEANQTTNLTATATSGLPVSFSLLSGPANLVGDMLSFTGTGTVQVVAIQAGDNDWNPAPNLTNTYSVGKTEATIVISNKSQVYDGSPKPVDVTTDPANLNYTVAYIINGTWTTNEVPVNAGRYIVGAAVVDPVYQAGTAGFLIISKADQVIANFTPADGGMFTTIDTPPLLADASSGLDVVFNVISGPGVIAANTLSFSGPGTVEVEASQPGDGNFNPAIPLTNTYTVISSAASVTLQDLSQVYDGTPRIVTATTTPPGLTVDITYDGGSTAPINAGSYEVVGTVIDTHYTGSSTSTLVVAMADQMVTNFMPATLSLFESTDNPTLSAGATSGLPVDFAVISGPGVLAGDVLSFTNSGTVLVEALQVGDGNWAAATPVTNQYSVDKAMATLFINNTSQIYDGTPKAVDTDTIPSNLPVVTLYKYDDMTLKTNAPVNAGIYSVFAGVVSDPIYHAEASNVLTIAKANQIIANFVPVDGAIFEATETKLLLADASSGLDVVYTVSSGPGVIVSNMLSFTGPGTVVVKASQPGDTNWNAAVSISHTYTVNSSSATVVLSDLDQVYDGTQHTATATTTPSGLMVDITYDGSISPPVNAGSYEVIATINEPLYIGSTTGTLTIAKADQTISNFVPVNGATFTTLDTAGLLADSTSGFAVSFAVVSGPGQLTGNMLSFTGAGTVEVTASQAGDANWNAAPMVTNTYTISTVSASVTLDNLNQVYDGTARMATATTTPPNLTVDLTYDGSSAAPTNASSYEVIGTINDPIYSGASTGTLTVAKADQMIIDFMPIDQSTFETTNITFLTAQADSGLEVDFTVISGPGVILAGDILGFLTDGTVEVAATQAGDGNWNPAMTLTNTYTIGKSEAQVFITNTNQVYDGNPHAVDVTTSPAGLPVVVNYTLTGVRSAQAPVAAGVYTVTAGIDNHPTYQGSTNAILTIAKADQTISNFAPADGTIFVATDTPTLSADASSGLDVVFTIISGSGVINSNVLSFTGEGPVVVEASQPGNENYNAAPAISHTYNVSKATAAIAIVDVNQTYDGTAREVRVNTSPSGLTVDVTYDGNPNAPTNVGSYEVIAIINDPVYSGSDTNTLVVSQRNQLIYEYTPLDGTTFLATDSAMVTAKSTSDLPVSFSVVGGPGQLSGNTLSFTGAGEVLLKATQAGDSNWEAAVPVTNRYTVVNASATVIITDLFQTYDGGPHPVAVSTTPAGLTVDVTYDGSTEPPTNAGTYEVIGTIVDPLYSGTETKALTVAKADQVISTFSPPTYSLFETTDVVDIDTAASSGLPVTLNLISGSAVLSSNQLSFTDSGTVEVEAVQGGDSNWNAAPSVTNTYSVEKTEISVFISNTNRVYDGTAKAVDVVTAPTNLPAEVAYYDGVTLMTNAPVDAGTYVVGAGVINDPIYHGFTNAYLIIEKADQTITNFIPVDGSSFLATDRVELKAGAESGLRVVYTLISGPGRVSGEELTFTGPGIVEVEASQGGDENWNAAPSVTNTYTVAETAATVTLDGLNQVYDGTARVVTATTIPSGLTVDVTYDGGSAAPTNAGSYTVIGAVNDPLYSGASTGTLVVAKADQVITNFVPASGTAFTTTDTAALSADATSGGEVVFSIQSGPGAITNNVLSFTGAGTVNVEASQVGDANWYAATPVTHSHSVSKSAAAMITLSDLDQVYDGTERIITVTTDPAGLTVEVTYDGSSVAPTNVGSYAVEATLVDDIYAGQVMDTLNVTPAVQTITFPAIASPQETTNQVTLIATADSGLSVSYAIVSGPGSVAGDVLSFTAAGTVLVEATQPGDVNWTSALPVTNSVEVLQASASLTLTNLTQVYTGSALPVTAITVPDSLAVDITYDGSPNAPTNVGSYTVIGTINDPVYSGSVTETLEIVKADQVITNVEPPTFTLFIATDTTNLTADASSGLPVSFSVISGPGIIDTNTWSLSFSSSGTVEVAANQAGDANWNAATTLTNVYSVDKAPATIIISNTNQTYTGSAIMVDTATSPTGLPVNVFYDDPRGVRISGAPTEVGMYTVFAGVVTDPIYHASTNAILTIEPANQVITNFVPASGPFETTDVLDLMAGASSGLAVEFTVLSGPGILAGNQLNFTNAGVVEVEAAQPGNTNWNAAVSLTNVYTVAKTAASSIVLNDLNQVYDGNAHPVTVTTDPVGLSVDLTYDGSPFAPTNAGTYDVLGVLNDPIYSGGITGALIVAKADQVISNFVPVSGTGFLTTDSTNVAAAATSGFPVSFTVVSGPGDLAGNLLTFTASGTVEVEAVQVGDMNWNAAPVVTNSYNVTKDSGTTSITLLNTNQVYDGTARVVTATTVPPALTVDLTYDGSPAAPTNAGIYEVIGTIDDVVYAGMTTGTLTVALADQVITFPAIPSPQFTTNIVTLAATADSGLPVSYAVLSGPGVLSSNVLSFTGVGTVLVEASQTGDANWNAAVPVINSVDVANTPPVIDQTDPIAVVMSEDGDPVAWVAPTLSATDIDGDSLEWLVAAAPVSGRAYFSDGSDPSSLIYTPDPNYNGMDTFIVAVTDGTDYDIISINVTIDPVNDVPVFTSVPVIQGSRNQPYTYSVTVFDVDGDPVTLSAPVIADWMTLTGFELTGTPNDSDPETNPVELLADDGVGGLATQVFEVIVLDNYPAPIPMSAIEITTTNFIARWKPTDEGIGYYIDVATSTNFAVMDLLPGYDDLSVGDSTSALVTGTTAGVTYYYQLRAEYMDPGSIISGDSIPSDPVLADDDSPWPKVDYTNAVVSVGAFDFLMLDELFDGTDLVVEISTNTQPGRVDAVLQDGGLLLNYNNLGPAIVELRATAPNGAYTRLPIELLIVPRPSLDDSGAITINTQNGLFEQTVFVENNSLWIADTVTLTVTNISESTALQNATSTDYYGRPEIKWVGELAAGASQGITLQLYTSKAIIPWVTVEASLTLIPPSRFLDRFKVPEMVIAPTSGLNAKGEMVIEFGSIPGEVYYIQYKDNMLDEWMLAYPAITAITERTQWIDSGPPFTATPPGPARFYRVVQFEE